MKAVYENDLKHNPIIVKESEYEAGDTFTFRVYYRFYGYASEDFTLKVYSSQDLQIFNQNAETNQLHMDGTKPSGFIGLFPYEAPTE